MATPRHPALRARVAAIDVLEASGGESTVLPSTSVVLGIQYRGRVHGPGGALALAGVTGVQGTVRTYGYAPGTGSILVRFTPAGAACLGVPVHELADRSVPLDAILPRARVDELIDRVAAAPDEVARRAAVEAFLAAGPLAGDALVSRALTLLEGAEPARVATIARALEVSERQLERRFLAAVGVTPRAFASLRRFERALAGAAAAPSLSALAHAAGYYDQSHFIREVRRFAGAPPREVFARTRA